jgi:hypothetical protein
MYFVRIYVDAPVAILRFGQNKTTGFTEGESVLFECHVKASPDIFSISWFHGVSINIYF